MRVQASSCGLFFPTISPPTRWSGRRFEPGRLSRLPGATSESPESDTNSFHHYANSACLPAVFLTDRPWLAPLASDGSERNYDAVKAAASSLNPPRFGDAIFLFGHPEDEGSVATFEQLKQIILAGGTRFYGVSFTDPLKDKVPAGFDPNKPLPNSFIPAKLDQMAVVRQNSSRL